MLEQMGQSKKIFISLWGVGEAERDKLNLKAVDIRGRKEKLEIFTIEDASELALVLV